jgi:mannosyltransferase OCH1-like enzyme
MRYALLYIHGGVYADIKSELIRPLDGLFLPGRVTTVISRKSDEIYQGIVAAPPRQPIFLALIDSIVRSGPEPPYALNIREFYRFVLQDTGRGRLQEGEVDGKEHKYKLFTEVCDRDAEQCHDGPDRYGLCCRITLEGQRVIKTRYSDFPW